MRSGIQVDGMDDQLRNGLWNCVLMHMPERHEWSVLARMMASECFKLPLDSLKDDDTWSKSWLRERFFEAQWFECYDLIECLAAVDAMLYDLDSQRLGIHLRTSPPAFRQAVNSILEREMSGYRFVGPTIAPITNPTETEAVAMAISDSDRPGLTGASIHLKTAVEMLGKRPNPDYRNSIKESVSAVEFTVNRLAKTEVKGVDGALAKLTHPFGIHRTIGEFIKKLYGFASDASGVRHALKETPDVGLAEAKLMLVSSAAVVNFMLQKADAHADATRVVLSTD